MLKLENVESSKLILVDGSGEKRIVTLSVVRTTSDLGLSLATALRHHQKPDSSDFDIIVSNIHPNSVVGLLSFAPPETTYWQCYKEIVPWFESRGFSWSSDAYELMSAEHFAVDYPEEFSRLLEGCFAKLT